MTWQRDAETAGLVHKRSKPYTAMLIARCVEPAGYGGARKTSRGQDAKCTLKGFADLSGVSNNTITKYLRTWDAMAKAGLVPSRSCMEPGEDVELPEIKAWTHYYREANPPKAKATKDLPPKEEGLDIKGRVDLSNKRVQTAIGMADGVKGKHPAIDRISDALREITLNHDANRAFVSACAALADLAADLQKGVKP